MIIDTEQEMMDFGVEIAGDLSVPVTIELVGDVGVGKTTFVKGLARGLGIGVAVSSPSFTLMKAYAALRSGVELHHYDFYRLMEPGIMVEELAESVGSDGVVTVVEWGESVDGVMPKNRMKIVMRYLEDGRREVEVWR